MKTLFVLFSALFLMKTGVFAQNTLYALKFDSFVIECGNVEYGSDLTKNFSFQNVSKSAVTLKNATSNCSCLQVTKPSEPFAPNQKGVITVKYDTKRVGAFNKTVTITTDMNYTYQLTIKGQVLPNNNPGNK